MQNNKIDEVLIEIEKLLKDKEFVLIAVDGRCGAGKTTFAEELEKRISCTVVHVDDFFLRPEQRSEERLKIPGENLDHERFLSEVLIPLSQNKEFSYRPYICSSQTLGEPISVVPKRVAIVEGSYSCHKDLWDYYDLHIFMDIDGETQMRRIIARNGEGAARIFKEKWIPLEENYFKEYSVKERCEFILNSEVDNMDKNIYFEEVKKNFGFGCMRLPMNGEEVDYAEFTKMIDTFMENGFNYFDTAHVYVSGKSETALRDCLTSRYPRESYILTNKLSTHNFNKNEEIRPLFESQLEACGVDYFDFYLMHAQDKKLFEKYKSCRAYETALEFKKEGKIKHLGISFHDKANVLEEILSEYPEIEAVQIQFNYADYEDPSVESRKCYEVCRKYNKPVIVMEPVKGGALVNLPSEAQEILNSLNGGSAASYAIRFAASFEGIMMVLSGMGNMEMMLDNISYMKDFEPLNDEERKAIDKVCEIFKAQNLIPCTACRYCVDGCPKKILIPDLFACMNGKTAWKTWNSGYYYSIHTQNNGKASDCIECGKCEDICPQHLNIRELLKDVAKEFDKEA